MREPIQDRLALSATEPAIGELRLVHQGHWVAATLGADLCWRSEAPEIVPMLRRASGVEALVAAMADLDPAAIRRLGRHALYRAASRVRGRVTLPSAAVERELQLARL